MELNFTDGWLRKLKAPEKREEYRDRATKGLLLRVSPSGVKAFSYYYRIGKKTARITIGKYPDITLKEARTKADFLRQTLASGVDPRINKKKSLEAREQTVQLMVDKFIKEYAIKSGNSSWKQAASNLRLYLVSKHAKTSVKYIQRTDIKEILKSLNDEGKHVAANRALAHMRKFFNWLVEEDYLDTPPTDHVKPLKKEYKRERVLRNEEIRAIWSACEAMSGPYCAWIKLCFLCGQRRIETSRIQRSQIIGDYWELTGAETKNKQLHLTPLSRQAFDLVQKLLEQDGEYLIKSGRNGDKPINGFSKAKVQLDKLSGVTDWRIYDIRRTVSSNLPALGVSRFIIERVLNHKDNSVTGIYDRYSYLEEKRDALQKWADRLDDIVRA